MLAEEAEEAEVRIGKLEQLDIMAANDNINNQFPRRPQRRFVENHKSTLQLILAAFGLGFFQASSEKKEANVCSCYKC